MRRAAVIAGLLLIAGVPLRAVAAQEPPVGFSTPLTAEQSDGRMMVTFAVRTPTDVEVAILGADGSVARHLAAGVLGGQVAPPAPLRRGLSQHLEWDGKDDYGQPVADASACLVRVRAGMGVKLDRIVGGDPYTFYSKEMGQGDHAAWRITGLEAKRDGSVYVLGNANNYGPAALRRYDAEGNYLCTVYPPPAGKKVEEVKGWGVRTREDGTYTFQYNDLSSPALSNTFLCGNRGRLATLIPSPERDQLLLAYDFQVMRIHTDGTIPARGVLAGRLVNVPSMTDQEKNPWKVPWKLTGQLQACLSAGGRHLYISGIFAGTLDERRRRIGAEGMGFWRDGQVFNVDLATRTASVFFALEEDKVIRDLKAREASPIADARYGNYAALQGVAVDGEGRVFICDRQNERVVVLDSVGKVLREIPLAYPDAIAVSPKSKAVYVTTRTGHYHRQGELKLLKFGDWTRDTVPDVTLPLCEVRHYSQATHLVAVEARGEVVVWVAYTALPVRVYRDSGRGFALVKDFYKAGRQRALDLQHFVADQKTGNIYIADGFGFCSMIADWTAPKFLPCMVADGTPLEAISLAIDARNRWLYAHSDRRPITRYRLGGEFLTPAPIGGSGNNACTPKISNDWRIGLGKGDRGIAAAPDGSLASLGALGTGDDYGGYLRFFRADPDKAPWEGLLFKGFGEKVRAAGVRFDHRGNLYVGKYDGPPADPPRGFEKDANFLQSTGRIFKFTPTGSLATGSFFPTEPSKPAKVYNIHYGSIGPSFSRTPRFGVDGWGRIYYPTSLLPQVSVIDNEGNAILRFGTYGNRDSTGGLLGDLVPVQCVPMAWPNSVDATDDYIYVSDIVNIRLLRLEKTFQVKAYARVRQR